MPRPPLVARIGAAVVITVIAVAGCSASTVTAPAARRAATPASAATASTATASTATATPTAEPTLTSGATGPARAAAATTRATTATPCVRSAARRAIVVVVHRQHAWFCDGHRTVRDSPVTTGAVDLPYDATPTGTFRVQAKERHRTLTLVSGAQYTVAYWVPFDAPLFGFHDSPWQTMPYGSARYRTKGSHGCVHLPAAAMRFLYRWAEVGTTVRIRT